jgi:hypothetical protein
MIKERSSSEVYVRIGCNSPDHQGMVILSPSAINVIWSVGVFVTLEKDLQARHSRFRRGNHMAGHKKAASTSRFHSRLSECNRRYERIVQRPRLFHLSGRGLPSSAFISRSICWHKSEESDRGRTATGLRISIFFTVRPMYRSVLCHGYPAPHVPSRISCHSGPKSGRSLFSFVRVRTSVSLDPPGRIR